jgi:hypothetical protein
MGFNPKGKAATEYVEKEYSLFTGVTDLQVVKFNPSKKDIIEMKNLNEERAAKVNDPQYKVEIGGKKYTRVELHTYIEPNKIFGIKDENGKLVNKYQNKH